MSQSEYAARCAAVRTTFVAAFPAYVRRKVDEIAPGVDVGEGIRQGAAWLAGELQQWAGLAASAQGRGPRQIFQTAIAVPTAALGTAGVRSASRDATAESALPGDEYGLAPASSREIGEEAFRAHVAWGVARAREMAEMVPAAPSSAEPVVAVVTMDQGDRGAVQHTAAARGLTAIAWRNPGAIEAGLESAPPKWAVVDMSHRAAEEAVRLLATAGVMVAVYGSEPDDIATARWMSLGASTVIPRRRLVTVLEAWLPLQA